MIEPAKVNIDDFLARTKKDQKKMFEEVWKTIAQIEHPQLKAFVDAFNTPGHDLIPYQVVPCNLEIRTRFGEMLLEALKRPELSDNPREIKKVLDQMAKETNRILAEYDILAK